MVYLSHAVPPGATILCVAFDAFPCRRWAVYFTLGDMRSDVAVISDVVAQWRAVRKLCAEPGASLIPGAGLVQHPVTIGFRNLPLVLAYAVLEQVLEALAKQSTFEARTGARLAELMNASRTAIPWTMFEYVDFGRERRNDLAHDGVLLSDADCLSYIEAIEKQLRIWTVLADDA